MGECLSHIARGVPNAPLRSRVASMSVASLGGSRAARMNFSGLVAWPLFVQQGDGRGALS